MKSCCDTYCANHGCNQGRDCPVRIERVRQAKAHLDRDALRGAPWRRQMRHLARALVLTLAVMLVSAAVLSLIHP